MQQRLIYSEYYATETTRIENKRFTLEHTGIPFDIPTSKNFIETSEWIGNNLIEDSIRKNFEIYLGKYTSGFLNPESNTPNGELNFGIDDYGYTEGIPYQGKLPIKKIFSMFNDTIDKYVICKDMELLKSHVHLSIHKVKYTQRPLQKIHKEYESYLEQMRTFQKQEDEYLKIYSEWHTMMTKYSNKLTSVFNDPITRSQLYEFIKEKDPTSCVLKMMDCGYQLILPHFEFISVQKQDPTNPLYWLCIWRDVKVEEHKKIKPKPIHRFNRPHIWTPSNILTNFVNIIPNWMQSNPNMNIYIIRINFTRMENMEVYYKDIFNRVIKCFRTEVLNDPCCLPI